MGKVGNRIRLTIERPPRALVESFRDAAPPDLADAMNKSGAMRELFAVYAPMRRMVGPALTVKVPTGDALMIRKAMTIAQPGDVIVIDGRGTISRSLWGGNRSKTVAARGIEGVVIDGGTRDIDETRDVGLPLFARAICPMASASAGPGEINYPVACGGVVVNPGDIVVGDAEGIVVIPRADAADVHAAWQKIVEREREWSRQSSAGQTYGTDDVDALLAGLGCQIVE